MDISQQGLGKEDPRKTTKIAWVIIFILFLAQVTNYADKTVVSIAAPGIMKEFGLSHEQYGLIGAAFFSLYAISGLLVAFIVSPRYQPRKIMAVLLVIWSLTQLPIVLAASFPVILICRTLLGAGEGAATPTALNAAHEWFPNSRRNIPSALVMFGTTIGAMVSAPVLTGLMVEFGWRAAFLACAVLGAGVLLLWLAFSKDGPYSVPIVAQTRSNPAHSPIKVLRLLKDPSLWGVTVAGTAAYWVAGFQVSWLAPFLNDLTSDPVRTGWFMSWIFGVQAACTLCISSLAQLMMRRGYSSRVARSGLVGLCLALSGIGFVSLAWASGLMVQLGLLTIATGTLGAVFPLFSSIISEVTPPEHRNTMMTVILSIVTVAGVPASIVTGHLVDAAGNGWTAALCLTGGIALAGAYLCFFIINPEKSLEKASPVHA